MIMSASPLTEKYRPSTLEDLHCDNVRKKIFSSFIKNGYIPHMLFHGPSGSGKTSSIISLAKDLYKKHYNMMVMQLNGSDDRGINVIRNNIKNFSKLKNIVCPTIPKLIILDEADSMTNDAQSALRRVMEIYSNNVRFCLICNHYTKLIPAIQSRCVIFKFTIPKYDTLYSIVNKICCAEKINIDKQTLDIIIELSNGDIRKKLNCIEKISNYNTNIKDSVYVYFFGIHYLTFLNLEKALLTNNNSRKQAIEESVKSIYYTECIPFISLLNIIICLATKHKKYKFMHVLSHIEYNYYQGKHSCVFLYVKFVMMCLIKYFND